MSDKSYDHETRGRQAMAEWFLPQQDGSKPEHTPMPWRFEEWRGKMILRGGDRTAILVAESVMERDARLLQAAPKLLKALQGVVHHDAALKPEYKLPESLMRQVTQAIADATN